MQWFLFLVAKLLLILWFLRVHLVFLLAVSFPDNVHEGQIYFLYGRPSVFSLVAQCILLIVPSIEITFGESPQCSDALLNSRKHVIKALFKALVPRYDTQASYRVSAVSARNTTITLYKFLLSSQAFTSVKFLLYKDGKLVVQYFQDLPAIRGTDRIN